MQEVYVVARIKTADKLIHELTHNTGQQLPDAVADIVANRLHSKDGFDDVSVHVVNRDELNKAAGTAIEWHDHEPDRTLDDVHTPEAFVKNPQMGERWMQMMGAPYGEGRRARAAGATASIYPAFTLHKIMWDQGWLYEDMRMRLAAADPVYAYRAEQLDALSTKDETQRLPRLHRDLMALAVTSQEQKA